MGGREGKSFSQGCQCVLLALSLSASLLREDLNVRVPTPASDCKPKPNAHALGTGEH